MEIFLVTCFRTQSCYIYIHTTRIHTHSFNDNLKSIHKLLPPESFKMSVLVGFCIDRRNVFGRTSLFDREALNPPNISFSVIVIHPNLCAPQYRTWPPQQNINTLRYLSSTLSKRSPDLLIKAHASFRKRHNHLYCTAKTRSLPRCSVRVAEWQDAVKVPEISILTNQTSHDRHPCYSKH